MRASETAAATRPTYDQFMKTNVLNGRRTKYILPGDGFPAAPLQKTDYAHRAVCLKLTNWRTQANGDGSLYGHGKCKGIGRSFGTEPVAARAELKDLTRGKCVTHRSTAAARKVV